jgi:hypothetical protein
MRRSFSLHAPNAHLSKGRAARLFAAAGLALGAPAGLCAQEIDPDPRFWLEAGVYIPEAETEIGIFEADRTRGTLITLEDELGFDSDASSVDLTIGGKIDDDFFFEGSIFAIRRDTSVVLDEPIEVEGVIYDVGAAVDSEFDTDIYRLSFGYRFIANEKFELAAMLGAHVTDFGFVVEGEGTVATDTTGIEDAVQVSSGRTVLAPLPVVGLQGKFRPIKWLELRARGDVFDIEVGPYDGRLVNLEASATGAITRNIAAGVAYRSTDYRVRIDEDNYAADLDYLLDGFRFFVRFSI